MKGTLQIAIDGPVSAGKGTVSKIVAERLKFLYVDTGAMYRATALLAKQHNVEVTKLPEGIEKLQQVLQSSTLGLRTPQPAEQDGRLITVLLNGEDVSWEIRTQEISKGASFVSKFGEIRELLVEKQQKIAESQHVVMEGRDITFKVLPDAQLKIYLDAKLEIRANRRYQEYLSKGLDVTLDEVIKELRDRDYQDMNREIDPLHIAEDAWVLDTSEMTVEEVVATIEKKAKSLLESM